MIFFGAHAEFGPGILQVGAIDVITIDCRIKEFQINYPTQGAPITCWIRDRQGTPIYLLQPTTLTYGGSADYGPSERGRPMPGGITVFASALGLHFYILAATAGGQ
jgi:hypothetical protein